MKTEPITIVVHIKARSETRDSVRIRLLELAEMTRREEGSINYNLHVSSTDDCLFIIYENWKDQAALDHHMSTPYLKDFLSAQDDLLEKPVAGEICRVIE